MKQFLFIPFISALCISMMLVSCLGTAPTREVELIDSLNQVAYAMRYKNLYSSCRAATQAYTSVKLYNQGKAEAANNLGFCAFMRMDFERAEQYHKEVYNLTKNELELLIADIGLMKIYQRTAMNKEFFDYRNSALIRMKRINEDSNLFVEKHEKQRLNYARSEFSIVSAVYYYYLQQRPEAVAAINEIHPDEELVADTNQTLYYHYIKGSTSLCEGETPEDERLNEFDELYTTWKLASRGKFLYFEGNGVQGIANLMSTPSSYEYFRDLRSHSLMQFGYPVDTLLPLRLGQLALQEFKRYKDLYQIAGSYVSIGKYLNQHGRYKEALDTLTRALDCVNEHYRHFYSRKDSLDRLHPFDYRNTFSTEKLWIRNKVKTVPEWISRIREQMSVSYAGMGMKLQSDYNRNIYLDILEDTRQDKEWESRYQALDAEARQLNIVLSLVVIGGIVVALLFALFNRNARKRNKKHLNGLRQMLDICQKITSSIPADARSEEDIVEAILLTVKPDLESLFGTDDIRIENRLLVVGKRLNKDERAIIKVIAPYISWALENGMTTVILSDERRRLEKQRYVHEQHIAENKRQNVIKKACLAIVNGIHPYIDRIINEVHKLLEKDFIRNAEIKAEKYQYMDELVSTINEYNDILALWIKMKQGTLSLSIETFGLDELFNLLRKGSRAFEMKQQELLIMPTNAYVKADKALTLFMINTLAENARKYTPKGGIIKISAEVTEKYVEISVEDNGCGLSEKDVTRIVGEKLYNSQEIGINDAADKQELLKNKGSGFGLMNCKGIIEKYRKTNEVFSVCLFNIESTLGKGSCFYFRLPVGIRKTLSIIALIITFSATLMSCSDTVQSTMNQPDKTLVQTAQDTLSEKAEIEYEKLLNKASEYANAAYYSNIDHHFEQTLLYADSAIACLNAHYKKYARFPHRYMKLEGEGDPAEWDWWNKMFNTDFHVILDIRNETAVAFLALKRWDAYAYNNAAYTTLYKLLGEDQSLERYCRQLERSTNNKMIGIMLSIILLASLLLGYYILYVRKRLVNRWNLEQVFEINEKVFSASLPQLPEVEEALKLEEDTLQYIPQQIVDKAFESINELLIIDSLGIAVFNEFTNRLEFASNPDWRNKTTSAIEAGHFISRDEWVKLMQQCYESKKTLSERHFSALPLIIDVTGESRCIGVLSIEYHDNGEQETDVLLLELIARYVAIVVFNAVVKIATKYRDIESAHEETYRASWEDGLLHVQNMVLDNCLSTIKHETIYYPNKIKQLIGKLRSGQLSDTDEKETVLAINELIEYYKGIYTILSSCASRQLEDVTFRRGIVSVDNLFDCAAKYFRNTSKGKAFSVSLEISSSEERITGDFILLRFLLESLIDEALSFPADGELYLKAEVDEEEYIRFGFTDKRRNKTQEELNLLFYPDLNRMTATAGSGELKETEYLICKQIIRDHDEFVGRRGCRIYAEPAVGGGFTVYFTIPKRKR